jgi:hypothetical protein
VHCRQAPHKKGPNKKRSAASARKAPQRLSDGSRELLAIAFGTLAAVLAAVAACLRGPYLAALLERCRLLDWMDLGTSLDLSQGLCEDRLLRLLAGCMVLPGSEGAQSWAGLTTPLLDDGTPEGPLLRLRLIDEVRCLAGPLAGCVADWLTGRVVDWLMDCRVA